MKVLLDTGISRSALDALAAAGHDAVWAGEWQFDPGDEEILSRALAEGRTLVTVDKDFGELAVVHGVRHAGIVRLVGLRALQQGPVCLRVRRVRIRPPEGSEG